MFGALGGGPNFLRLESEMLVEKPEKKAIVFNQWLPVFNDEPNTNPMYKFAYYEDKYTEDEDKVWHIAYWGEVEDDPGGKVWVSTLCDMLDDCWKQELKHFKKQPGGKVCEECIKILRNMTNAAQELIEQNEKILKLCGE